MSIHDETWDRSVCRYCHHEIPYGQSAAHMHGHCTIIRVPRITDNMKDNLTKEETAQLESLIEKLNIDIELSQVIRKLSDKHIDDEELPLLSGKHRNKASKDLGQVYRMKTNPPHEYPEVGGVESINATNLLASAYAEIDFLKKKLHKIKD